MKVSAGPPFRLMGDMPGPGRAVRRPATRGFHRDQCKRLRRPRRCLFEGAAFAS